MRFRERMAQFMIGRRGTDEFTRFLLIVTIIVILVSCFLSGRVGTILWAVGLVCLVYSVFRMFSRNISQRQKENNRYLKISRAVRTRFRTLRDRWRQRKEYCFFRCPSCHTLLRVPKGKGKLLLTCRKCGNRFEKRT